MELDKHAFVSDSETESKLRENLFDGNVQAAKDYLDQILSDTLRERLRQVIHDYEN
jgi:hypothetical protein